jgi:hypothetical protein
LTDTTSSSTTSDSPPQPDFDAISNAPYEAPQDGVVLVEQQFYEVLAENSRLRYENEKLEAEISRLEGRVDATEEKAKLIRPFSWWVFGFASVYCLIIFGLIALDGVVEGVTIDRTVLSIMAGTTAASMLGLVSVILTGLFKSD